MQLSTIRPGLLVSLKTSCRGNVNYRRQDIERGPERSQWETTKTVEDPAEYERAKKAQTTASNIIRGVCSASSFGLLCPMHRQGELEAAINEARAVVDAFNETATLTRVSVYVITGKVAQDDVEAVKAINSEMRDLLAQMELGIDMLDTKRIREAANKATKLGAILSPDAFRQVKATVAEARRFARKLVKAGEQAATTIDKIAIEQITASRTMFLDLDEAELTVQRPQAEARAVDLNPEA